MKAFNIIFPVLFFGAMITMMVIKTRQDDREFKKRMIMLDYFRCMRIRDAHVSDSLWFVYFDSTNYYFDQWRAVK